MRNLQCFAVFLTVAVVLSAAQDYCNLESCKRRNEKQTLCLYPNPNPGPQCGQQVKTFGPTQDERNMILNTHNNLRKFVADGYETRGSNGPQPKATNMKTMVWDTELEKVAQRWANQCNFGHDSCRDVPRFGVGQNVGIIKTTGPDNFNPNQVIQSWYDEVKDFDRNDIPAYRFNANVGHYTQLIWAESTRLGCGSIRYREDGGWNSYYLVCNYGPAGNVIGWPIYKTA